MDSSPIHAEELQISPLQHALCDTFDIQLDLLRLDLIHPNLSGNKWFKLRHSLDHASKNNYTALLSFGGAYSNHLHALAYAGYRHSFKTIGIIRGEKIDNPTLQDCRQWGMELHFISREQYREKNEIDFLSDMQKKYPNAFIIPEGGSNALGLQGCREILQNVDASSYDTICCPIGTATTFTGIAQSLQLHQNSIGFPALKNAQYLESVIQEKIPHNRWRIEYDYHQGGFAKCNATLLQFIDSFYQANHIVLDFVYTAKMMMGIFDLISKAHFQKGQKILALHTGGLQGNQSKPALNFSK